MIELILEMLRFTTMLAIVASLFRHGRKYSKSEKTGLTTIQVGIGLLLFGATIDVLDDYQYTLQLLPGLASPLALFLEKGVGYLGGFVLVAIGFSLWMPIVATVHDTNDQLSVANAKLESALQAQIEYNSLHREFVSMASHEFRTPLSIIDGNAQRILRKIDRIPIEEIGQRVGNIRSATERMIGLIDSTLSADQLEAGKIKMVLNAVDLTRLLTAIQGRLEEIAPSHQFSLELDDLPDEIRGDSKLLEQVFTNLLSNAVKYSPDDPRIEVTGRRAGEDVILTVRDHGLGVPADELPRLFQRYFRASTTIGIAGTGIGLHVVKTFAEMHGGSVDAESVEGKGTTFTVRLPISGPQEQGMDGNESPPTPLAPSAVSAVA